MAERRLNREGSAYLAHYARTINAYPDRTERRHILAAIQAIPGNEAFTFGKLTNWFARNRGTARPAVLVDDETILFPALTPTHLQQLRVLYRKVNNPAEGVITFWAKRIGADRAEVAAWIEYQHAKAKETESPDASPSIPRPHLPTPAKSLSPQTRMPSLPPIAIKVEDRHPSMPVSATLEDSLRKSLCSTTTEPPPKTTEEFEDRFQQVECMIDSFMKKYQSGQLEHLGWGFPAS